ncbi:MAG TPA: DUF4834 family protein [Bacteroidales bacterium]|nr:DUF4834 family protein [Bacteroidales bacterium]
MFKFLIGILVFFGLLILLVVSLGLSFLRALFGFGRKRHSQPDSAPTYTPPQTEGREKIFGKHEGEYIDFEEITENDKNDE